jgi:protein-tyrosine phosphatase
VTKNRLDVHSHLLPGVDDGCETLDESIACARMLVAAGYSATFCTPHVWPGQFNTTTTTIPEMVAKLEAELEKHEIPLRLIPGGELNLRPGLESWPEDRMVTFGLRNRHVLVDLWADELPAEFDAWIRFLKSRNWTIILAHPERMKAVQSQPTLMDRFAEMGLLLQGNLKCLSDPLDSPTRSLGEKFLVEGRYFLLGSDLHHLDSLPGRMDGLARAIELVGENDVDRLTVQNSWEMVEE